MITILHNPRCSTSRAALDAASAAGVEVDVVEYLDSPLGEQALLDEPVQVAADPRNEAVVGFRGRG